MTLADALRGINAYPLPQRTLEDVAQRRSVNLNAEVTTEILHGANFNLARADILLWLSYAPNISQGGQSYSFTDAQRTAIRNEAADLLDEFGEDEETAHAPYGYKGSRL